MVSIKSDGDGFMDTVSLKIEERSILGPDIFINDFKDLKRMNFSIIDLIDEIPALKRVRQSALFINVRDNNPGHLIFARHRLVRLRKCYTPSGGFIIPLSGF